MKWKMFLKKKENEMSCAQEIVARNESVIRALAEHSSMEEVMIGVHNACAHGEIFDITGEDVSEGQLEELFEHFDAILALFK